MKKDNRKITLDVEIKNIDEYINKAKLYVGLLKEAKTLAEELASVEFEIDVN